MIQTRTLRVAFVAVLISILFTYFQVPLAQVVPCDNSQAESVVPTNDMHEALMPQEIENDPNTLEKLNEARLGRVHIERCLRENRPLVNHVLDFHQYVAAWRRIKRVHGVERAIRIEDGVLWSFTGKEPVKLQFFAADQEIDGEVTPVVTAPIQWDNVTLGPSFSAAKVKLPPRVLFQSSRFPKKARFEKTTCGDNASFEKTAFGDNASFQQARFDGSASFDRATFGNNVSFFEATFIDNASFHGAIFGNNTFFQGSSFGGSVSFWNARFGVSTSFHETTFSEGASFRQTVFGVSTRFLRAKFGDGAYFGDATFGDGANFARAKFGDNVSFDKGIFGNNANFTRAKFGDGASFREAAFGDDANFTRAKFGENASFGYRADSDDGFPSEIGATFGDNAIFERARFDGTTSFEKARFEDGASFEKAKFGGDMNFQNIKVNGKLRLVGANLEGLAQFRESEVENLYWNSEKDPSHVKGVFEAHSAKFKNAVIQRVDFSELVDFSYAEFGESGTRRSVTFKGVTFGKEADFLHAKFLNDAIFIRNRFRGIWDLTSAKFQSKEMDFPMELSGLYIEVLLTSWREIGNKIIFEGATDFLSLQSLIGKRTTFMKEDKAEEPRLCLSFNLIEKLVIERKHLLYDKQPRNPFPDLFSPPSLKESRIRAVNVNGDGSYSCADLRDLNGEHEKLPEIYETLEESFRQGNDRRGENEAWYLGMVADREGESTRLTYRLPVWAAWILLDIPSRYGIDLYRVGLVSILIFLNFSIFYGCYFCVQVHFDRKAVYVRLVSPPDHRRALRFRPFEQFFRSMSQRDERLLEPWKDGLFFSARAFFKLGLGGAYPRTGLLVWVAYLEWGLGIYMLIHLLFAVKNTLPIALPLIVG